MSNDESFEKHTKEEWFKMLYVLAIKGDMTINKLYESFKLEIAKESNWQPSKPSLYFYNSEYRWCQDRDGSYYRAIDVDNELDLKNKEISDLKMQNEKLKAELDEEKKTVDFYGFRGNWFFGEYDCQLIINDADSEEMGLLKVGGKIARERISKRLEIL